MSGCGVIYSGQRFDGSGLHHGVETFPDYSFLALDLLQ